MDDILVSIVVPVYNAAEYLREGIRSLTEQTYRNLEIVLVDDGSTDESSTMCDTLAAQDDRIVVIHQANRGVSVARNTGVRAAHGGYLMFFDPDDKLLVADCIAKALDAAIHNGSDVIVFEYCNIDERNNVISKRPEEPRFPSGVLSPVKACEQLCLFGCENYIWRLLINRRLFTEHDLNLPPYATYEDLDWIHKAFLYANAVTFLPEVMYGYRHRSGQQTASYPLEKLLDMYDAVNDRHADIQRICPELAPQSLAYTYAQYVNIYRKSLNLPSDDKCRMMRNRIRKDIDYKSVIRNRYLKRRAFIQIIAIRFGFIALVNAFAAKR